MKTKEKNIEDELHLLKLVSITVPSLTLLVCSLILSLNAFIVLSIFIIGSHISWRYNLKGFYAVLLFFVIFMSYILFSKNLNHPFSTIGLFISMMLSMLIIFLAGEESKEIVLKIQSESESRLNNLIKLDEKQQKIDENYALEKEQFLTKIDELQAEKLKDNEKIDSLNQLNLIVKNELEFHINQYNQCKLELFEQNNKAQSFENKIILADEELKKQKEHIATLESLLEFSEEEKINYEKKYHDQKQILEQLQNTKLTNDDLSLEKENEIENLKLQINELKSYQTMEQAKYESICNEKEEKLLVFEKLLEESSTEKQNLLEEIKKLKTKNSKKSSVKNDENEKKYKELLNEFNDKSLELEDTRRALFRMQDKLFTIQRENEETKRKEKNDLKATFEEIIEKSKAEKESIINSYELKIEELNNLVSKKTLKNEINV